MIHVTEIGVVHVGIAARGAKTLDVAARRCDVRVAYTVASVRPGSDGDSFVAEVGRSDRDRERVDAGGGETRRIIAAVAGDRDDDDSGVPSRARPLR